MAFIIGVFHRNFPFPVVAVFPGRSAQQICYFRFCHTKFHTQQGYVLVYGFFRICSHTDFFCSYFCNRSCFFSIVVEVRQYQIIFIFIQEHIYRIEIACTHFDRTQIVCITNTCSFQFCKSIRHCYACAIDDDTCICHFQCQYTVYRRCKVSRNILACCCACAAAFFFHCGCLCPIIRATAAACGQEQKSKCHCCHQCCSHHFFHNHFPHFLTYQ